LAKDKVSIVIPVYNSEAFLRESLESVLNQTYKNLEIIAIDDGSTDNSLEILYKYSDKVQIISQQNQGLAAALNNGIKKITGRWFKWFSSDDVLYPEAIEKLVLKAEKLPENTIVYSNWEIIDENNKKLRDFSESNYNDLDNFDYNIRLLDGQQINVNTTLIPTALFDHGCLFKKLEDPVTIDYDFFLRASILYNVKFFLIQDRILKYRLHTNQLSHKNITKTLSNLTKVKKSVLSELPSSTRKQYLESWEEYKNKKTIPKKTLEFGLKLADNILPSSISDRLIIFYLNKIRRSRS